MGRKRLERGPHPLREMGLVAWAKGPGGSGHGDLWDVWSSLCLWTNFYGRNRRKYERAAHVVADDVWRDLQDSKLIERSGNGWHVLTDATRDEAMMGRMAVLGRNSIGSPQGLLAEEAFTALLPIPTSEVSIRIRPAWAPNAVAYARYAEGLCEVLRHRGRIDGRDGVLRAAQPRDPVAQFVDERVEVDPNGKLSKGGLWRAYREWAAANIDPVRFWATGRRTQDMLAFEVCHQILKTRSTATRLGLRLTETP